MDVCAILAVHHRGWIELNCNTLGLDWNTSPEYARTWTSDTKTLQGNLDPCQLYGTPEEIRVATQEMLQKFGKNHIANLGHGVYPDIPVESIQCFVKTVQDWRY
ncbi:MAG: uroporphyrinogen decarboxylase family protein [Bacteroidota bacterium]